MNKPADIKHHTVPLWIGGKAVVPAGRSGDVYNPATGEVSKKVPLADAKTVDAAVKAAAAALPAWRGTPPLRRARVMQKFLQLMQDNQQELARLVSEEHGKTLPDAAGSVQRGIEVVEFACGIPHLLKGEFSENVGTAVDTHTLRQPVGVCAGITPFNFPAMVPVMMGTMAGAVGNAVVNTGGTIEAYGAQVHMFTSLAGVAYPAAGATWHKLTPLNGWKSAQTAFSTGGLAYTVINGVVYLAGGLHQPTVTNSLCAVLPIAARPTHVLYLTAYTTGLVVGTVRIQPNGNVYAYSIPQASYAQQLTSFAALSYPRNS